MKTPNLLVVPALLCAAVAFADPDPAPPRPLSETFEDWVVIDGEGMPLFARRDEFAPVYARADAGALSSPALVDVYRFEYRDGGDEGSVVPVTARKAGRVRVNNRAEPGVVLGVLLEGQDTPIRARIATRTASNGGLPTDTPTLRGNWTRPLRVRTEDGQPLVSDEQAAVSRLPAPAQLAAAALRERDPAAFRAVLLKAQDGQDVSADVAHALHGYPPEAAAAVVMNGDRADVWASMHPVERAVVSRLPPAEQAAFRRKIAAARTPAAATALLGEIRRASAAFIRSGGDVGALDALKAAMSRIARAGIDENTGTVTFDGAAAPPGGVVATGGQRTTPPQDPGSVVNSAPQRIDSGIRPVPGPGRPMSDQDGGGIGGLLGGVTKSPLFAAGSGALAGALIGFAVAGPFGAFFGALVGMPLGLMAGRKLFGMSYGGEG